MNLDPFTPWQEEPAVLRARNVSRDSELQWLAGACRAYLDGGSPTWCLVVGPRGIGKSHLLQLVRGELPADRVRWIGEDTAANSDPDALWEKIWNDTDPWGWVPAVELSGRRILFVEGLDRLLATLKPAGRWALRHHLQESGAFLVGTAVDASFASSAEDAFFGQLDTWVLEGLDLDEARRLFLQVTGESEHPDPATTTRREALIRLAGGNPRALVTLADAVKGQTGDAVGVADGLLLAVQRSVTHYQQRFHDLPPLGQQILQVLARAPRQLTATEVQGFTGATSAAVSGAAKALEKAGALERHADPDDARVSRYQLGEPLFRYWLESRSLPWDQTRAAWLGRLLGQVLHPGVPWWAAETRVDDLESMVDLLSDLPLPMASDVPDEWTPSQEVHSLIALGLTALHRFERVATALAGRPSVELARRLLRQLAERENGPLHVEMELVWQALHRGPTDP
ncbi:MAG: MarR family transcriptional regulator [Myxococcota bacterium]